MKFYRKDTKRGFTLLDILLTTAIVSLLSSLFLSQVTEARKKADDAHMKTEAQQVASAINLYKNDNNGRVPLSVSSSPGSLYTETDTGYQDTMQILVDGGYISEIPTSPDGQSYTYATDADNEAFFAFKLEQGESDDNLKNSCSVSVTDTGSEKTYTGCSVVESCTANASQDCFPESVSFPPACTCDSGGNEISTSPETYPSEVCANRIMCNLGTIPGTYIQIMRPIVFQNLYSCTYTVEPSSTPTCDGSSTADYCVCM